MFLVLFAGAVVVVCLVFAQGIAIVLGGMAAIFGNPDRFEQPAQEDVTLLRGEPLTERDLLGWDGGDELEI